MNFGKWLVLTISKNIEGGVSATVEKKDTKKSAMDLFYYNCDKIGTNPSTAFLEAMIINPYGDVEKVEKIDNTQYENN